MKYNEVCINIYIYIYIYIYIHMFYGRKKSTTALLASQLTATGID